MCCSLCFGGGGRALRGDFLRKEDQKKEAPSSPLLEAPPRPTRTGREGLSQQLHCRAAMCFPGRGIKRSHFPWQSFPRSELSCRGPCAAGGERSPRSTARGRGHLLRGRAEAKPHPAGGWGEGGAAGSALPTSGRALAEAQSVGTASLSDPRRREAGREPGPGGILPSGHYRGSMEKRGPVLHIVVVGFHHKKGCQVRGRGCPSSPAFPFRSLPSPGSLSPRSAAPARLLPPAWGGAARLRSRGEGLSPCGRGRAWWGAGGFAPGGGLGSGLKPAECVRAPVSPGFPRGGGWAGPGVPSARGGTGAAWRGRDSARSGQLMFYRAAYVTATCPASALPPGGEAERGPAGWAPRLPSPRSPVDAGVRLKSWHPLSNGSRAWLVRSDREVREKIISLPTFCSSRAAAPWTLSRVQLVHKQPHGPRA